MISGLSYSMRYHLLPAPCSWVIGATINRVGTRARVGIARSAAPRMGSGVWTANRRATRAPRPVQRETPAMTRDDRPPTPRRRGGVGLAATEPADDPEDVVAADRRVEVGLGVTLDQELLAAVAPAPADDPMGDDAVSPLEDHDLADRRRGRPEVDEHPAAGTDERSHARPAGVEPDPRPGVRRYDW